MLTVEDILMSKGPDVLVAPPTATVYEAVKMMTEANVGSVVIKNGEEISGVFTERDLLRRVITPLRDVSQTTLEEVMSSPVRSVTLSTDVHECRRIFLSEHIRHLAVCEDGALVGMVSLRDVLKAELDEDEKIIEQLENQTAE